MIETISRRSIMLAGAAGLAVTIPPGQAAGTGFDPRTSAEGQIKMTATLDGSPAFWLYFGVIYALQPGEHPRAILGASGCQTCWAERQPDGSYRVTGATLTFFRDLETGAILESFDNPITGKTTPVKSNFLAGASVIYPADGSSMRIGTVPTTGGVVAPQGYGAGDPTRPLGRLSWRVMADSVMVMADHSWPVPVQPQLEAKTESAAKSDFFDPRLRRMKARYSGTTISPWLRWMDMAAVPGHLVWHTSGEKDFSLDGTEPDYRAKAGDLMDKLASKP